MQPEELTALPRPSCWLTGQYFSGGGGDEKGGRERISSEERNGRDRFPLSQIPGSPGIILSLMMMVMMMMTMMMVVVLVVI